MRTLRLSKGVLPRIIEKILKRTKKGLPVNQQPFLVVGKNFLDCCLQSQHGKWLVQKGVALFGNLQRIQ